MDKLDRRIFIARALVVGAGCVGACANAQGVALVDEKDAQAVAIGYRSDTSKVDGKKYPQHKVTQSCSNCQLYVGKPADASGDCAVLSLIHI